MGLRTYNRYAYTSPFRKDPLEETPWVDQDLSRLRLHTDKLSKGKQKLEPGFGVNVFVIIGNVGRLTLIVNVFDHFYPFNKTSISIKLSRSDSALMIQHLM